MTERIDADWSVREFHGLDFGDTRLNRRLLILAEAFGAQPAAPINQASADWQDAKAAYYYSCSCYAGRGVSIPDQIFSQMPFFRHWVSCA
jgi:transposase-like protein